MKALATALSALALAAALHFGTSVATPVAPAHAACETHAEGRNVDATYFAEMLMMLQQKPHPFAVKALMDWKPMEGTRACWNPLSTTWDTDDSANFNCLNPPECTMGVQDFPNRVRGQQATAKTLALSFYSGLRNFLAGRSFDHEAIRQGIYTWGGDEAYANVMIERWENTWEQRRAEALKPPTGVSATSEGAVTVIRWNAARQGQQAITVWRWEAEAWRQIGRVGANVSEYTDRSGARGGSYMVCAEGTSDSACSDKSTAPSRGTAAAGKVNVTSFPATAHRGTTVFIRAVTSPGAACSVSTRPGAKTRDAAEATADKTGAVTWSWPVVTNAATGSFPVTITCGTASVTKNLTVS